METGRNTDLVTSWCWGIEVAPTRRGEMPLKDLERKRRMNMKIETDMSPEVHCNWCNHCYILGMPDPRPDIRCVQYLSEVHKKVPNEYGHKREPLKSGPDIRDPKYHWISNRYPPSSGRCQKWIRSIIRCQQWIQNIMRCHRDL